MSPRLKKNLIIFAKMSLLEFCSFVMAGITVIPLYVLALRVGWMGQDGLFREGGYDEFAFTVVYLLAMLLSSNVLFYIYKSYAKSRNA